jgi:hypothetical protein
VGKSEGSNTGKHQTPELEEEEKPVENLTSFITAYRIQGLKFHNSIAFKGII